MRGRRQRENRVGRIDAVSHVSVAQHTRVLVDAEANDIENEIQKINNVTQTIIIISGIARQCKR